MSNRIAEKLTKNDWSLIDFKVLDDIIKVMTYGSSKHGRLDYLEKAYDYSLFFSAAMRHLSSWKNGEIIDQESGYNNLSMAIVNLIFLRTYEINGIGKRDI